MGEWNVRSCRESGFFEIDEKGRWCPRPHTCQEPEHCPHCATQYSEERGATLYNRLRALMQSGRLWAHEPTVKAFALEFTMPAAVSWLLGELVLTGNLVELRKWINALTRAISETLTAFFGEGWGAELSWHMTHSDDPLARAHAGIFHFHAHLIVPNMRIVGGVYRGLLRRKGKVTEEELEAVRAAYHAQLERLNLIRTHELDIGARQNFHFGWITKYSGGKHSLKHRCRYQARHALTDLLKYLETDAGRLTDVRDATLKKFLVALERVQPVRLQRRLGSLSPNNVKKLGLREEKPESTVRRVEGYIWRFSRFDSEGVYLKVIHLATGDSTIQYFEADRVNLSPRKGGKRYVWDTG